MSTETKTDTTKESYETEKSVEKLLDRKDSYVVIKRMPKAQISDMKKWSELDVINSYGGDTRGTNYNLRRVLGMSPGKGIEGLSAPESEVVNSILALSYVAHQEGEPEDDCTGWSFLIDVAIVQNKVRPTIVAIAKRHLTNIIKTKINHEYAVQQHTEVKWAIGAVVEALTPETRTAVKVNTTFDSCAAILDQLYATH